MIGLINDLSFYHSVKSSDNSERNERRKGKCYEMKQIFSSLFQKILKKIENFERWKRINCVSQLNTKRSGGMREDKKKKENSQW